MCGIAGIVALNHTIDPQRASTRLTGMLNRLRHRGPDEQGSMGNDQVWLGNTRLSIVGEDNGRQPIWNEDKSIVVVMNGEIYNAPELKRILLATGHQFSTDTDTEVLVHCYEEFGLNLFDHLNGMFAFAIYDIAKNEVIIARDRFGMKPLYLLEGPNHPGDITFASELNALKGLEGFDDTLSPEGISTFLGSMYISEPFTAYKNVRALQPGCMIICCLSHMRTIRYFDMSFNPDTSQKTEARSIEAIADVLPRAVSRHLMADRPVGTLLSGGLDSRAVATASWLQGSQGKAFTVGYDEPAFDESPIAATWAKTMGKEHHILRLSEAQFTETVPDRLTGHGQPYAIWVNSASQALASNIRDDGYKAVLTGEGGDELFCGYPTLHAANLARYYRYLPQPVRNMIATATDYLPAGSNRLPLSFMAQSFAKSVTGDLLRTFYGFKEVIRYSEWRAALTPEAFAMLSHIDPAIAFTQYSEQIADWPLIDQLSYIDIKSFLASCSLVPNDNAYMSQSVETRIPFLDLEMINLVKTLPLGVRFSATEPKRVLKKALNFYLEQNAPQTLASMGAYKKMGFEVPTTAWINGPKFGRLVDAYLNRKAIQKVGFFNPDYVSKKLNDQRAGRANNERVLQTVMALQHFMM